MKREHKTSKFNNTYIKSSEFTGTNKARKKKYPYNATIGKLIRFYITDKASHSRHTQSPNEKK